MVEFEISLVNQIDYEVKPLTLLEIAARRWGSARVIEGGMEGAKHEPD